MAKQIAVTRNRVLSVTEIKEGIVYGFDLHTDKFVAVKRSSCMIDPPFLDDVIKSEKLRITICDVTSMTNEEAYKKTDMTIRSYQRKRKDYLMPETN